MIEDTSALVMTDDDGGELCDWHGRTSDDFDDDCGDYRYAGWLADMVHGTDSSRPRRNYDYVSRDCVFGLSHHRGGCRCSHGG